MNKLLMSIILSILPISELRGGIPAAVCNGIPWYIAFMVCVALNILIIFPIFFFLDYLHKYFMKLKFYKKIFNKYIKNARRKAAPLLEKYGMLGLAVFVGIPLPITGAYTGTIIAWFLGMNRKKAIMSIALGVLLAGIIVTLVSVIGISSLRIFVKGIC